MKRAFPLVLLIAVAGCGAADPGSDFDVSDDGKADYVSTRGYPKLALPASMIPVPLVAQKKDYTCGDASTLAVLRYWYNEEWKERPESDLYQPLGTTSKDGTDPRPMADFLAAQTGMTADFASEDPSVDDLQASLDGGDPTIVDLEAWQAVKRKQDMKPWATDWIDGHYVVLVGSDAHNFFFMDPSTTGHYAYIPKSQFADRWHDVLGNGPDAAHVQHMTIFVHGTTDAYQPTHALPPRATIIN
jgi:predicted double-glycine peptidase